MVAENEFKDKVVLITGAGRGLGRAIAEASAARQAIVAANDLTPINLDVTLQRITSTGGRVKDYTFDISKKMVVQTMVDQALSDWGRIDILVNHAVVRPRADLLTMDEWDWQRTLDVNLTGPFLTLQRVGQVMRYQGGGVVVNVVTAPEDMRDWDGRAAFVAGQAAFVAGQAAFVAGQAAFVASQAGLIGLTRQAAGELAGAHIRVNAVCAERTGGEWLPAEVKPIVEKILFLCSAECSDITGQIMGVGSDR